MSRVSQSIFGPNLFRLFMEDFGNAKAVAEYLHVTERTVYRWLATDHVPRAAVLALYWESRYGDSHIQCDLVNEIRLLFGSIKGLEEQLANAIQAIGDLRKAAFPTANEPAFQEFSHAPISYPTPIVLQRLQTLDTLAQRAGRHQPDATASTNGSSNTGIPPSEQAGTKDQGKGSHALAA